MDTITEVKSRGRTLRSAAERQGLLEAFFSAGGSQSGFCRTHGIHPATFSCWLRNHRKVLARPRPAFREVQVPEAPAGGVELMVRLPNGIEVLARAASSREAALFVREVASC